jgi:hypothetical protein
MPRTRRLTHAHSFAYPQFHGECDLVLLHNPEFNDGQGMDVHIRTKIADFWSSVESAAIRLGEEIMEINANPESDEWLWVNGEVVSSGLEIGKWYTTTVGGFLIRYKESSASVREANIYIKGAVERMVFKTFKSFVRVDVDWERLIPTTTWEVLDFLEALTSLACVWPVMESLPLMIPMSSDRNGKLGSLTLNCSIPKLELLLVASVSCLLLTLLRQLPE